VQRPPRGHLDPLPALPATAAGTRPPPVPGHPRGQWCFEHHRHPRLGDVPGGPEWQQSCGVAGALAGARPPLTPIRDRPARPSPAAAEHAAEPSHTRVRRRVSFLGRPTPSRVGALTGQGPDEPAETPAAPKPRCAQSLRETPQNFHQNPRTASQARPPPAPLEHYVLGRPEEMVGRTHLLATGPRFAPSLTRSGRAHHDPHQHQSRGARRREDHK
jgi:hypothetical protein